MIALQPTNAIALNNLAYDMAVREKKPAEALPMARKALVAPDNATILDTVGWIEFLLGNNAEAARLLVQAAKGAPRNAEVRLHNAMALAAQGARAAAADRARGGHQARPGSKSVRTCRNCAGRLPAQN